MNSAENTGDIDSRLLDRAKGALQNLQKEKSAGQRLKTIMQSPEHDVEALREALGEAQIYGSLKKDIQAAQEVVDRWQAETPHRIELENAIQSRNSSRLHQAIAQAEKYGMNVKAAKKLINTLQREEEVERCIIEADLAVLKRAIGAAVAAEADKDVVAKAQKFLQEQTLVQESALRTERLRECIRLREVEKLQSALDYVGKQEVDKSAVKEAEDLLAELLREQEATRRLRRALQDEGHDAFSLAAAIKEAAGWNSLVDMVEEARETLKTWV